MGWVSYGFATETLCCLRMSCSRFILSSIQSNHRSKKTYAFHSSLILMTPTKKVTMARRQQTLHLQMYKQRLGDETSRERGWLSRNSDHLLRTPRSATSISKTALTTRTCSGSRTMGLAPAAFFSSKAMLLSRFSVSIFALNPSTSTVKP